MTMQDAFARADELATRVIAANSRPMHLHPSGRRLALCAGSDRYRSLWTRDLSFGGLGAISIGHRDVIVDSLSTLLDHSRDGLVPRRVATLPNALEVVRSLVGVRSLPLTARSVEFRTWAGTIAMDSNATLLCLLGELCASSAPVAIIDRAEHVERVAGWLATRAKGGVRQGPFADWKDLVARRGHVLYTNVVAAAGMRAANSILIALGRPAGASVCLERSHQLARHIQDLWDPVRGQFRDWAGDESGRFSADGNLLASFYGLADAEQIERVLGRVDRIRGTKGFPLPAAVPSYPLWMRSPSLYLAGISGYHDALGWPWQDCVEAMVRAQVGDTARAEQVLHAVARAAAEDGSFYEVYSRALPRANVVRTRLYSAEPGFTWSAGLYLRARHVLRDVAAFRSPALG